MYAASPPGIPYWLWLHSRGVLEAVALAARAGKITTSHPVPAGCYAQWLAAFRIRVAEQAGGRDARLYVTAAPGASPCMTLVIIDGAVAA
jgi:hypothetical protein